MEHSSPSLDTIPVVILAGGQSNRLTLDNKLKWQLPFGTIANTSPGYHSALEQTLLSFIIQRLNLQTNRILINGPFIKNTDLNRYGLPIIDDVLPDFQGPLSGILTALLWARDNKQAWVATISCDSPFFPDNLLQTLASNLAGHKAAIAEYDSRTHPTFGFWSTSLYQSLKHAVEVKHVRAVNRWALEHAKTVKFTQSYLGNIGGHQRIDPFFNINTFADYQQALNSIE